MTRRQRRVSGNSDQLLSIMPKMQGVPGPSHSLPQKRKDIEASDVNVSVQGKKAKKSGSPPETGETAKAEPQWPDYFKEVSF